METRCSEQNRRKTVTQSFRGLQQPKGRHVSPAASDSRIFASCWPFFVGARTTQVLKDSCPLLEGATKANPAKAGDAKLRGYRTPCVPGRSSRRTSLERGSCIFGTSRHSRHSLRCFGVSCPSRSS